MTVEHPTNSSLRTFAVRIALVVSAGIVVPLVGIAAVLVNVLFAIGLSALVDASPLAALNRNSVELPSWGRPVGAEELMNYPSCDGNARERLPCRTMEFGTNRSFAEVTGELKATFDAHGWSTVIGSEKNDPSLHARASDGGKCVWFSRGHQFPAQPDDSDYLRSRRAYNTIIGVFLDKCWPG